MNPPSPSPQASSAGPTRAGGGPGARPSAPSPLEAIAFGRWGMRTGWRVALWMLLVAFCLSVIGTLAGAAGLRPTFGLQVTVELLAGLLAGWGMIVGIDRRPPGALGFAADRAALRDVPLGFVLGGGAIAAAAAVLAVAGSARWVADGGSVPEYVATLGQGLVFFAVAAAAEEVLFRGYAFQALVQGIGAWPAVLLTSGGFALAHAHNPGVSPLALATIFLAGVMLSWAYLRTRSLWFCTAVHLGWNWTMSALLDFPVSGLMRDTPLYSEVSVGPRWLTGGDFGPEGGVLAIAVVAGLTVLLLRARWVRESETMRARRPLVDARLNAEPGG